MKKKKKVRVKKQAIFNLMSVVFLLTVGIYYLTRLIHYKIENDRPIELSSHLATRLKQEDDTYTSKKVLIETNDIYRYVGNADNNYLQYRGYLWRIVRINEDNSVTMVTEEAITYLPYGGSLQNYILSWLNHDDSKHSGIFEDTLESDELLTTKICLDKFPEIEVAGCFEGNKDYKIGLLSVYDYMEADATESYLNNGTNFWTTNSYDSSTAWYIAEDGLIGTDSYSAKYGIRPVITLSGDTVILSGNGTSEDPYLIEERDVKTLQDSYVGEYIRYQDQLWRIISKQEGKVKIASESCLQEKQGECKLAYFSKYSNDFNETEEDNLLYDLNHDYYRKINNDNLLTEGNFYTGTYSLTDNNYRVCLDDKLTLHVGFLSVAEPFAFEVTNTFLMTTSPNNEMSIYTVNDAHAMFEDSVTQTLAIRPVLYMKDKVTITGGKGNYLSPYELGGLEE